MVIGLVVLFFLSFVVFLFFEIKEQWIWAYRMKGVTSLLFVLIGLYAVMEQTASLSASSRVLFVLFMTALVFGLLGDLVLALRPLRPKTDNIPLIQSGITYFSIGHMLYYIGLVLVSRITLFPFVFSMIVTILVVLGSVVMKFEMGKARIPSYLYSFLIFLMVGQAISFYQIDSGSLKSLLILIGAVLFGISDLILAMIYFRSESKKVFVVANLTTYYVAQLLLALSLTYFLR